MSTVIAYYFCGSDNIIAYHSLVDADSDGACSCPRPVHLEGSLVSARAAPHPPNGSIGPLVHVGVGRTVPMLLGLPSSNPPLDCTSIVELHAGWLFHCYPRIRVPGIDSVLDVTSLRSNAGMNLLEFSSVFIVAVDSHAHGYK